MTLEEFVTETSKKLKDFRQAYYIKHEQNPEQYPLSLPENNDGLWLEFLLIYLQTGEA